MITHEAGILQFRLPSLKSTRMSASSCRPADDNALPTALCPALPARRRYLVGRTRTIKSVDDEEWLQTHVEPKLQAHVADAFIGVPSDVELPEVKRTTLTLIPTLILALILTPTLNK